MTSSSSVYLSSDRQLHGLRVITVVLLIGFILGELVHDAFYARDLFSTFFIVKAAYAIVSCVAVTLSSIPKWQRFLPMTLLLVWIGTSLIDTGADAAFTARSLLLLLPFLLWTTHLYGSRMDRCTSASLAALLIIAMFYQPIATNLNTVTSPFLSARIPRFFMTISFCVFIYGAWLITFVTNRKEQKRHQAVKSELDASVYVAENLLSSALPAGVAQDLLAGKDVTDLTRNFESATMCFIHICNYNKFVSTLQPYELVRKLDTIFSAFDALVETQPAIYKIETVGSTYLVASGLPAENPNHAEDMIRFLFLLQELCKDLDGEAVPLKIGVNSGPIAAGIIGLARCFYRVFGSTVNIASRMMSHGVQDHIHLSPTAAELLRGMERKGKLLLEPREPINVKGRGMMTTYFAKEITSPTPLVPKTSSVNVNSLRRYLKGQERGASVLLALSTLTISKSKLRPQLLSKLKSRMVFSQRSVRSLKPFSSADGQAQPMRKYNTPVETTEVQPFTTEPETSPSPKASSPASKQFRSGEEGHDMEIMDIDMEEEEKAAPEAATEEIDGAMEDEEKQQAVATAYVDSVMTRTMPASTASRFAAKSRTALKWANQINKSTAAALVHASVLLPRLRRKRDSGPQEAPVKLSRARGTRHSAPPLMLLVNQAWSQSRTNLPIEAAAPSSPALPSKAPSICCCRSNRSAKVKEPSMRTIQVQSSPSKQKSNTATTGALATDGSLAPSGSLQIKQEQWLTTQVGSSGRVKLGDIVTAGLETIPEPSADDEEVVVDMGEVGTTSQPIRRSKPCHRLCVITGNRLWTVFTLCSRPFEQPRLELDYQVLQLQDDMAATLKGLATAGAWFAFVSLFSLAFLDVGVNTAWLLASVAIALIIFSSLVAAIRSALVTRPLAVIGRIRLHALAAAAFLILWLLSALALGFAKVPGTAVIIWREKNDLARETRNHIDCGYFFAYVLLTQVASTMLPFAPALQGFLQVVIVGGTSLITLLVGITGDQFVCGEFTPLPWFAGAWSTHDRPPHPPPPPPSSFPPGFPPPNNGTFASLREPSPSGNAVGLFITIAFALVATYLSRRAENQRRHRFLVARAILEAQGDANALLENLFPHQVVQSLKEGKSVNPRLHKQVGVLWCDLCNFTPLADTMSAKELMALLNKIFSAFDEITESRGLWKMDTVGDAYVVLGGLFYSVEEMYFASLIARRRRLGSDTTGSTAAPRSQGKTLNGSATTASSLTESSSHRNVHGVGGFSSEGTTKYVNSSSQAVNYMNIMASMAQSKATDSIQVLDADDNSPFEGPASRYSDLSGSEGSHSSPEAESKQHRKRPAETDILLQKLRTHKLRQVLDDLFSMGDEMQQVLDSVNRSIGSDVGMRVGIHCGSVVTGVVGSLRPRFHVFGMSMVKAEKMEATGERGKVHCSPEARDAYFSSAFDFQPRFAAAPASASGGGGGATPTGYFVEPLGRQPYRP